MTAAILMSFIEAKCPVCLKFGPPVCASSVINGSFKTFPNQCELTIWNFKNQFASKFCFKVNNLIHHKTSVIAEYSKYTPGKSPLIDPRQD